ncbi:hypothetical protein C2I18_25720 [Paenibacillus sp. PK3_47]|uniref:Wadjet anti-phage system protein JetD domain-containing protein n=1 Tax=Paenibacillus sp. PK3_47 TaxID=2072642 RepID=UPI00201E1807|nr:DUF2399 domain-containing protein [Paenibacillus sp. PK3_47]UQZ36633.1 hypothetical protein C2I18_25720 [Paenibacillus sp. PK3_47]
MIETIKLVLERKYGAIRKSRHKVSLVWLEKEVESGFEYRSDYVEMAGGFTRFATGIDKLLDEGYLVPLSKVKKYKTSYLDETYWLSETSTKDSGWSEAAMLRLLDLNVLNLSYYRNHPEEQTAEVWTYIERIYDFLRTVEEREYVTREERSLELFDREKWLSEPEGIQFLSRLGLTLQSIKALVVRELFECHLQSMKPIRRVLISENHSFFDSAKRLMQKGKPVCGMEPEMLIYGEGWKIISSLQYLNEFNIEKDEAIVYYVGDMDKAGWDIYGKLKLTYPEWNIKLALNIYRKMLEAARQTYDYEKNQSCHPQHLDIVREEAAGDPDLNVSIERLLKDNKRIPQEVLNYEVMVRLA